MFGLKVARYGVVLASLAYIAPASPQPLTIFLQYNQAGSAAATEAMKSEVRLLLGKSMSVRFTSDIRTLQGTTGRLVVVQMRGSCSMTRTVESRRPGLALGSTFVSDGSVLPFGQVECDLIRASLQRIGYLPPEQAQQQFGEAVGRVLVHELYHMVSGSSVHTKSGVTKRSLSPYDLIANTASLPADSKDAMEVGENTESK